MNTERRIGPYRKGDDIAERLLDLGAAVIRLLAKLGRKPAGRTVVKQLEPEWTEYSTSCTKSTEVHEHGLGRARAQ